MIRRDRLRRGAVLPRPPRSTLSRVITNVYSLEVTPEELLALRDSLHLSRAVLGRFLGVAEITVLRWESGTDTSPRGLGLTVLTAIRSATDRHGSATVARVIRDASVDHGRALKTLFDLAYAPNSTRKRT